jgi:transcriptional regulator with XRE-family HTH domain
MPKKKTPARARHEDFGSRLAAFRNAAALTQSELARLVGVSRRQIAYYESGTGRPPGALLSLLADLFEVSTDVLLGREVPKAPADRLSRALLVQLRRAERLGADVCRRLEHVLAQFVAEEERKRGGASARIRGGARKRGSAPSRTRPSAKRATRTRG